MTNIYEQFDKAFARVSSFAVLYENELVTTINFKFPADGAGRLYAYVHWFGERMVRGSASGYGYDKRSAAVIDAVNKMTLDCGDEMNKAMFVSALAKDNGSYFDTNLRNAGFTVIQTI